MLHKNKRPFFLMEWQLRQLRDTTDKLRKLDRMAIRQLQRVGYSDSSDKQYKAAITSLANLATMMNSALQLREQILAEAREQKPKVIRLHFRTLCRKCGSKRGPSTRTNDQAALAEDPAWRTEIESLLKLVYRIHECLVARCTSRRTPPRASFLALSRLANALLRQRRHLQEIAPEPETEVKLLYEPGLPCNFCGAPTKQCAEKQSPVEGTEESGSEVAPEAYENQSTTGGSHEQSARRD